MQRWDVLGLGSATVDDFLYVPHFPAPDTKLQVIQTDRQGGGLTATALVAAARLGARVGFAGLLGHDDISRWVEQDMAREGIDVSPVVHRDDAQPIHAVIIVEQAQHTRTILYSVDGRIGADDDEPDEATLRAARVLFIDDFGSQGNLRAAKIVRAAGIPVVADFERGDGAAVFEAVLPLVDHLIVGARFAVELTGEASPDKAAARLWREGRALVAVTCGAAGCWYLTGADERPLHQDAFPVEAVDTTGCGDVFHGAYAAALNWDMSAAERIRFASATAALKATQPGGRKGIPTRAQVEAVLRQ
jgi:sugar/nucleoside kinase (ribokinase family)